MKHRLGLQRIYFLLPNNVFLYRFELLLMLPLTCINGSKLAVLSFLWDLLLPKIQRR